MILAVSTVKDVPSRLLRWVELNLTNGIDHMVVFVDDADPQALASLATTSHVTPVDSLTWWGGGRPARLNVRQRINANAVRAIATVLPEVEWILHIDADEVALIERSELAGLPTSVRAIRLAPYESVSQRAKTTDAGSLFKRLLTDQELALLTALGVISKATNNVYFHGHVGGKVAMRPSESSWLGTHHVVNAAREKEPAFDAPWLRLLHYESHTVDEFIRKWTNLVTSGGSVATRGARADLAAAVRGALSLEITSDLRREVLTELFDRHVADDLERLDRLGLLVRADPTLGRHRPSTSAGLGESVKSLLAGMAGVDKSCVEPGGDVEVVRSLLSSPARSRSSFRRR